MSEEMAAKLGELAGEVHGYQKSVEQYMEQNQREHHELFQNMNRVNLEVMPMIKQFEEHKRGHRRWLKTIAVAIGAIGGSIPIVKFFILPAVAAMRGAP